MKNITELIRCFHRHGIDDGHAACYAEGNVVDKRENKLIPWYQEEGLKIGYIDIEADSLTADFGTMLTFCIKEKDGPSYTSVITKDELFNGTYDKRLVFDLINVMKKFKILVGYYSGDYHYDIPFIRSKAMHYSLDFPGYDLVEKKNGGTKYIPSLYYWDLYSVVKAKMSLSRRSLDNATSFLGIKGKTPLDRDIWRAGKYGEEWAISEILKHNIADSVITEKLHNKLTNFYRWTRTG